MTKVISDFFQITDITVWQGVFLSSFFIPVAILLSRVISKWFISDRPLNLLLNGFNERNTPVFIFMSQLSAADQRNGKIIDPRYLAEFPKPTPTNRNNIEGYVYRNIDPVWSEADGKCVSGVFNLLGRVGKVTNIKLASLIKDWGERDSAIFSIGFNPKTRDMLDECQTINFRGYDQGYLSIDGHDFKIDSVVPRDAGVIQKTFSKGSGKPLFILAGLGTLGTEITGTFLNENAEVLGKLFGKDAFCILLETNLSKGSRYIEVKGIYPKPRLWRGILYPITFFTWKRRGVFPK